MAPLGVILPSSQRDLRFQVFDFILGLFQISGTLLKGYCAYNLDVNNL